MIVARNMPVGIEASTRSLSERRHRRDDSGTRRSESESYLFLGQTVYVPVAEIVAVGDCPVFRPMAQPRAGGRTEKTGLSSSPSVGRAAQAGQSHFHGEDAFTQGNVVRAVKIGTVPGERFASPNAVKNQRCRCKPTLWLAARAGRHAEHTLFWFFCLTRRCNFEQHARQKQLRQLVQLALVQFARGQTVLMGESQKALDAIDTAIGQQRLAARRKVVVEIFQ